MMLTGKHLLRTQNVSEQNQKHFLCPQTGKHLCRQQRVRNNVSSFARALTCAGKFPTQVAAHQSEPGKTGRASVCSYLRFYRLVSYQAHNVMMEGMRPFAETVLSVIVKKI